MSTINTIQSTTLSVELKIKEMQETYNVLEEHRIQVRIFLLINFPGNVTGNAFIEMKSRGGKEISSRILSEVFVEFFY
jgi:hypothetical protein